MKSMEGTASWTRPEWATLLGVYLLVSGVSHTVINVGALVHYTSHLGAPSYPMSWWYVATCVPGIAYTLLEAGIGLWVLRRPRKARLGIAALVLLIFVSGLLIRLLPPLSTHLAEAGSLWAAFDASEIGIMLMGLFLRAAPWAGVLVFLYTGRRKVFFAGEVSLIGCPACGYCLRGLLNVRCPECGTEYE